MKAILRIWDFTFFVLVVLAAIIVRNLVINPSSPVIGPGIITLVIGAACMFAFREDTFGRMPYFRRTCSAIGRRRARRLGGV